MTPRDLTPDERSDFEERAAIREFMGRIPRAEAERLALEDVVRARRPEAEREVASPPKEGV